MKTNTIKNFFEPSSIAVIGASYRKNSVGNKVFKNLLEGFQGKLYAVNPKHKSVLGEKSFASVKEIDAPVDLAVITAPAKTVVNIIKDCSEKNIKAAIIISAGFSESGKEGKILEEKIIKIAQEHAIRLIGPNCLGLVRPSIRMNATFDNNNPLPGNIALISQSGALIAGILDWAVNKEIGFSTVVSMGNVADVSFGEILDYLTNDPKTESILFYIEGIRNARHFINGLRTAAKVKPVIILKSGKSSQGVRSALSHAGALIGDDQVFDAAIRRCGAVRVLTIEELFSAAEILSSNYTVKGNRLLIVTNGGGAGVLAADYTAHLNIELPQLDDSILTELNKILPAHWSHQNPIDIIGDATPERYHAVLNAIKKCDVDGILTILVPIAMTQPKKVAERIVKDIKEFAIPIITCWMGEKQVHTSQALFFKHKIPCFNTPEDAIRAFSYLSEYHRNQKLLLEISPSTTKRIPTNSHDSKRIIDAAKKQKRTTLTLDESKTILKNFKIPVTETLSEKTLDEAVSAAKSLGFPVAMKIHSPDITHKQDVGGVMLNISNVNEASSAFDQLIENAKKASPQANILGVTVEPMVAIQPGRELLIGVKRDVVFGPVISFGAGGTLTEIIKDIAVELPPLNTRLAESLINRTHISKALHKFRQMPAVDKHKIIDILLRVSDMISVLPEIQEMDINPLVVDEKKAVVVDARIMIDGDT